PNDGGNFLVTSDEVDILTSQNSEITDYIRPFIMGRELLNNQPRYCLWLADISDIKLKRFNEIDLFNAKLEKVRQHRLKSKKKATNLLALTPHLFDEIKQPKNDYLAIPVVSSERRSYIP